MEFYWLLGGGTAIISALALLLYMRTGSVSFPLGVIFLYFWSLHGGWSIVADGLGEDRQKHHHYLYEKIFPIELNDDYLWALFLYVCFIIVIELTALFGVRSPSAITTPRNPVHISHGTLLLVVILAGFASYWIVKDQLAAAILLGKSGYSATRGGLGELVPFFTLHQVLNRVAVFPLAIGLAVLLDGREGKWLVGETSIPVIIAYALVMGTLFAYIASLGNKNELFSALILGGLFYIANCRRIKWGIVGSLSVTGFAAIALVDFLRAFPLITIWRDLDWREALEWLPEIHASNEAFGAHFSLYGALHFHAPLTYGSSLVSLLASVIPRILWPDRPGDIYAHYTASAGIAEGIGEQGFTIHHATGWYLNFGMLGVLLGALICGLVWVFCFNAYQRLGCNPQTSRWWYIFAVLAPWGFVAYIPPLVRAGIEGYKGMMIDALLVPAIVILLVSYGYERFRQVVANLFTIETARFTFRRPSR